jgi:SagB-type dehydrogenase family enzyme
LVLQSRHGRLVFRPTLPGVRTALEQLASTPEREERLTEGVLETDGADALPRFHYYLQRLTQAGLVVRWAGDSGRRLATLTALSPSFVFPSLGLAPERRYVLSRFAYAHRQGTEVVLESPLAHARITLHDNRAAELVHALAQPRRAGDLGAQVAGLPAEGAEQLLTLLVNADMAGEVDDGGTAAEDRHPALRCWEFHDLLFHSRSREGRHDYPVGDTYRFVGQLDPPPAVKPAGRGELIELSQPDLARLRCEDPPLAQVQEARRSLRNYADRPMTARQLGEFLYRVGRVKECREVEVATPHGPVPMDFALRPYPGGGALYELELYPVVNACAGLAPGLYHYDPVRHGLERLSGRTADVDRLLQDSSGPTGIAAERLQVLLVIAARFPRIAWKYASMAYAVILKHVGVVYQTMYLAATAMGLAPCGVGSGNADLFARAAGTDYYAETSVGEFLLGSKP